jgi:hypothetical protein
VAVRTAGRAASGVDISQRAGDPLLLPVNPAPKFATGHILKQRQGMFGHDKPAPSGGDWSSHDKPRVSERRGDPAPGDQVSDLGQRTRLATYVDP